MEKHSIGELLDIALVAMFQKRIWYPSNLSLTPQRNPLYETTIRYLSFSSLQIPKESRMTG